MNTTGVKQNSTIAEAGSRGGEEGAAMPNDGLILKFKDGEAFGHFCIRLTEERVSFRLAGNQTVVILGAKQVGDIPDSVRGGFNALKDLGHVEIVPLTTPGKRKLPTAEEADKVLEELMKDL